MQRQLDFLGDDLAGFATLGANGQAGGLSLGTRLDLPFRWAQFVPRYGELGLEAAVEELQADRILIHYATLGTKLRRVSDKLGIATCVHCHGYDVMTAGGGVRGVARRRGPGYAGRLVELGTAVPLIANSKYLYNKLATLGVPESNIHLKYFGVPDYGCSSEVRDPLRILFVGRLVGCKGPLETVRAVAKVVREFGDLRLDIVGDGPLREECESLVRELGLSRSVHFHGQIGNDHVQRLIRDSCLMVSHSQPSPVDGQVEAFGVAFVEAQMAGLPVVTGRSGGVPEIVVDGVTGVLFEPGDIDGQANAISSLLSDQARRSALGQNARSRAQTLFSLTREKAELSQILRQLQ